MFGVIADINITTEKGKLTEKSEYFSKIIEIAEQVRNDPVDKTV